MRVTKTILVVSLAALLAGCGAPVVSPPASTGEGLPVATEEWKLRLPHSTPGGSGQTARPLDPKEQTVPAMATLTVAGYGGETGIELTGQEIARMDALQADVGRRVNLEEAEAAGGDERFFHTGLWLRWNHYEDAHGAVDPMLQGYDVLMNGRGEVLLNNGKAEAEVQTALGRYLMALARERTEWDCVPHADLADLRGARFRWGNSEPKELNAQELERLEALLAGAAYTCNPPEVGATVSGLVVTTAQGGPYELTFAADCDIIGLGTCVWYDYGPGEGVDRRAELFELLGLPPPDWPTAQEETGGDKGFIFLPLVFGDRATIFSMMRLPALSG